MSEHIPSGFSISTISSFRSIGNKYDMYRGKGCMKKSNEFLRGHAMKIISFKKKKNEVNNKRVARIIRKFKNLLYLSGKFENKYLKDKKYRKVRDHCHYTGKYRGSARGICNLKCSVPKKWDQTMIIILT